MFMTFDLCDGEGRATGSRMCINMKTIDNIQQMGQWDRAPRQIDEIEAIAFNEDEIARPRRPIRRDRQPDTFTLLPQCVMLNCEHGNNYQVLADFDKMAKMLESLGNIFEGT